MKRTPCPSGGRGWREHRRVVMGGYLQHCCRRLRLAAVRISNQTRERCQERPAPERTGCTQKTQALRLANQNGTFAERLRTPFPANFLPRNDRVTNWAEMGIRANIFSGALPSERAGNGDAQITEREDPPCGALHRAEWLLVAEPEPPMGAHIVAQRRGYIHHGIYVGAGKVVHYAGLSRGLRRGPVEEISLSRFAAGHGVRVVSEVAPKFEGREVVRRARSRIGEDNYRLLTNNCEHFCEWCLRGEHRSYQVEARLALPLRALQATQRVIAELLSSPLTDDVIR